MDKKELLEASMEDKLKHTKRLIMEWYYQFDGNVYVAFSGGKDSTVLLRIVRDLYPEVEAVFCQTGLEYPEINKFVKTFGNVTTLKPKMTFKQVLDKYGYPIISKSVAMAISRHDNTKSDIQKQLRLHGGVNPTSGKTQRVGIIPKKWHYIVGKIKTTEQCCNVFKKDPFKRYEKKTGKKPFIGLMAHESNMRKMKYLKDECNNIHRKHPQSNPLMFWSEADILKYIRDFGVELSEIYKTEKSTGCVFCMYGLHMEEEGNTRFDRMKKTHPKLYEYCMNKLGLKKVIDIYIGQEEHNSQKK